jgi:hypothetical protein
MSNFFLDCEFNDDGRTIDLISIALVHEKRATYYAVSAEYDEGRVNDWVRANVLPQISTTPKTPRKQIADEILAFVAKHSAGQPAVIWGWYASYDWVALCQLYGPMVDLPHVMPNYIRDLKMLAPINDGSLPKKSKDQHNALYDAMWIAEVWRMLCTGSKI